MQTVYVCYYCEQNKKFETNGHFHAMLVNRRVYTQEKFDEEFEYVTSVRCPVL